MGVSLGSVLVGLVIGLLCSAPLHSTSPLYVHRVLLMPRTPAPHTLATAWLTNLSGPNGRLCGRACMQVNSLSPTVASVSFLRAL